MNSFTKKTAKAVVSTVILCSLLFGATACDKGKQPAADAPTSPAVSQSADATPSASVAVTPAPVDTSLTQAQKDAALKQFADKPLGIDPASVPVPADVTAAFGEKASANLVHDTLLFEQKTDGFHQLQVVSTPVDKASMAGIVSAQLSPMMTPDALSDTMKQFSSPAGTSVIPMFSDEDLNGIKVGDNTYHPTGDAGFFFRYGTPLVTLGTASADVVRNGQTMKVGTANVSQTVEFTLAAKEGSVTDRFVRSINLIATDDGHWLVSGYEIGNIINPEDKNLPKEQQRKLPFLTATANGQAGK